MTVCIVDDHIYWIWLSLLGEAANKNYSILLEHFGNAESIYKAGINEYECVNGLSREFAHRLTDKDLCAAREIYDFCNRHSVRLLSYNDPDYPIKLKWIYSCPILLYVYGELPNLNETLTVGMVGTRRFTDYGRIAAYKIGGGLARAKSVVVSGLALGIDGISHLAAINNGGKTVAVMGNGIDRIYPPEHRELAKLIAQNGAIVTEYPPGSAPVSTHFPVRNRIISGLSDAVVLVECNKKSGAMITARLASEQSRSVYAVPGDITSPTSYGPLSLLKDGAKPISNAADIIEDFVCQYSYLNSVLDNTNFEVESSNSFEVYNSMLVSSKTKSKRVSETEKRKQKPFVKVDLNKTKKVCVKTPECKEKEQEISKKDRVGTERVIPENLGETEKIIYNEIMKEGKINAESLVTEAIKTAEVMSALTTLEIKGHIISMPGGFYKLSE